MSRSRFVVLIVSLIASSAAAQSISNNDSCDIGVAPAATLLLPYFEVDFTGRPEWATTTLLSITNVTAFPQIARVTLWSDWAYPVLTFNVFLTGYDVQSINLLDVIGQGRIARTSNESPRGYRSFHDGIGNVKFLPSAPENCSATRMPTSIPAAALADLQSALTNGLLSSCGTPRIGGTHTDAKGYATIDLVADCTSTTPAETRFHTEELLFDNVLIGDYQIVKRNPSFGNHAVGDPMVHIRAVPEGGKAGSLAVGNLPYTFYDRYTPASRRAIDRRQPLPSTFAARSIQGGPSGFLTHFTLWREGVTASGAACAEHIFNRALRVSEAIRFDERENPTATVFGCFPGCTEGKFDTPSAVVLASGSQMLPPLNSGDVGGWMYFNLHNSRVTDQTFGRARATQNWMVVTMFAEGRYATAFTAPALGNGCSPSVPETTTAQNPIRPRP